MEPKRKYPSEPRKIRWEHPRGSGKWKECWGFDSYPDPFRPKHRERVSGFETLDEAREKHREICADIKTGVHVSRRDTHTWSEGFDMFLADNQRRHDTPGGEMSGYDSTDTRSSLRAECGRS
jgi:hypothetical protein